MEELLCHPAVIESPVVKDALSTLDYARQKYEAQRNHLTIKHLYIIEQRDAYLKKQNERLAELQKKIDAFDPEHRDPTVLECLLVRYKAMAARREIGLSGFAARLAKLEVRRDAWNKKEDFSIEYMTNQAILLMKKLIHTHEHILAQL